MYPILRFAAQILKYRKAPRLGMLQAHVSQHRCWPWDLDPWIELNNGRTLTLYDLGRVPMAIRAGIMGTLRERGWGITVAGNSVRYRRRIRAFHRFTMVSRTLGWDGRFLYMEQSMWRRGECCNHMLLRGAITGPQGIVAPAELMRAAGENPESPALPGWVLAWIASDGQRPWPPVLPELAPGDPKDDLPA
ncbi:MAG: acyl-CoA thioesterase [Paracoccus sp. (in: a-proteobacteria)]|uniref:acyl-CoA thioesterase n=1 Tax=Paracoccus sp. TaxID=267 RepID=UPI0039E5256F